MAETLQLQLKNRFARWWLSVLEPSRKISRADLNLLQDLPSTPQWAGAVSNNYNH